MVCDLKNGFLLHTSWIPDRPLLARLFEFEKTIFSAYGRFPADKDVFIEDRADRFGVMVWVEDFDSKIICCSYTLTASPSFHVSAMLGTDSSFRRSGLGSAVAKRVLQELSGHSVRYLMTRMLETGSADSIYLKYVRPISTAVFLTDSELILLSDIEKKWNKSYVPPENRRIICNYTKHNDRPIAATLYIFDLASANELGEQYEKI